MKKVEWANTDSRIEVRVDGEETTITVLYESGSDDAYYAIQEASVTMSTNEFNRFLYDVRSAIIEDARA